MGFIKSICISVSKRLTNGSIYLFLVSTSIIVSIYLNINYSNDINVSFENDSSIREIISSFFFLF